MSYLVRATITITTTAANHNVSVCFVCLSFFSSLSLAFFSVYFSTSSTRSLPFDLFNILNQADHYFAFAWLWSTCWSDGLMWSIDIGLLTTTIVAISGHPCFVTFLVVRLAVSQNGCSNNHGQSDDFGVKELNFVDAPGEYCECVPSRVVTIEFVDISLSTRHLVTLVPRWPFTLKTTTIITSSSVNSRIDSTQYPHQFIVFISLVAVCSALRQRFSISPGYCSSGYPWPKSNRVDILVCGYLLRVLIALTSTALASIKCEASSSVVPSVYPPAIHSLRHTYCLLTWTVVVVVIVNLIIIITSKLFDRVNGTRAHTHSLLACSSLRARVSHPFPVQSLVLDRFEFTAAQAVAISTATLFIIFFCWLTLPLTSQSASPLKYRKYPCSDGACGGKVNSFGWVQSECMQLPVVRMCNPGCTLPISIAIGVCVLALVELTGFTSGISFSWRLPEKKRRLFSP